jgi:hypothetical protein
MAKKSTELRPVMTRIPEGLRRRLEREAKRNARSMNAEIIHRLEHSLTEDDRWGGPEMLAVARLMATAFYHTGLRASDGKEPRKWLKDPAIYEECIDAVHNALWRGVEGLTPSTVEWRAHLDQEFQGRAKSGAEYAAEGRLGGLGALLVTVGENLQRHAKAEARQEQAERTWAVEEMERRLKAIFSELPKPAEPNTDSGEESDAPQSNERKRG